jgi:hypothetical protein
MLGIRMLKSHENALKGTSGLSLLTPGGESLLDPGSLCLAWVISRDAAWPLRLFTRSGFFFSPDFLTRQVWLSLNLS